MGLTKTVALEVAEQGITCNAICPGYVLTPLVEAQIPDQMKAHNMDRETVIREVMLDKQPTKQFVTVEQIARHGRVPVLRRCRPDQRHADFGRRRLDGAVISIASPKDFGVASLRRHGGNSLYGKAR